MEVCDFSRVDANAGSLQELLAFSPCQWTAQWGASAYIAATGHLLATGTLCLTSQEGSLGLPRSPVFWTASLLQAGEGLLYPALPVMHFLTSHWLVFRLAHGLDKEDFVCITSRQTLLSGSRGFGN